MVYGPTGAPVADLNAWAYARERMMKMTQKNFSKCWQKFLLVRVEHSHFLVCQAHMLWVLWLPPGSDYALPANNLHCLKVEF